MPPKIALILFFCLFISLLDVHAQILWQRTDSSNNVRRGNYILSSKKGLYLITDAPSNDAPGLYGGTTHILNINDSTGVLNWKQKVDLGNQNFEQFGFISTPKIDNFNNLVYTKVKVFSSFDGSSYLEKFHTDGTHQEVLMNMFSNSFDVDKNDNIYCMNMEDSIGVLQVYDQALNKIEETSPYRIGKIDLLDKDTFYLIGYKTTDINNQSVMGVLKTTLFQDSIWESLYVPNPPLTPLDYGYLVSAVVDSFGNIYTSYYFNYNQLKPVYSVQKINSNGAIVWQKSIIPIQGNGSLDENSIFNGSKLLTDHLGNCFLVGTISNYWGNYDGFVVKFSDNGVDWSKRLSYATGFSTRSAFEDAQLQNGYIYTTGSYAWFLSDSLFTPKSDFLAMKINADNGNLDWKATFSNNPATMDVNRGGISIAAKKNGVIYATGVQLKDNVTSAMTVCFDTNENVNGDPLIWENFNLTTSVESPLLIAKLNLKIYPNPASDYIALNLPDDSFPITISIYNEYGQLVKHTQTSNENRFNINILQTGIYFVLLKSKYGVFSGKFIKD
jgi:Secretion system C-terminal sorting domain